VDERILREKAGKGYRVAGTAIVGFLFGLLFLLTGNLLLPIILHGVLDLRMLAILRPPADTPS
jgi:membrane protease YdiL (CAAX protease family)